MKNIMDTYLNFTEKRIKKYMRLFYSQFYNEEIVNEYLKTYVNARYYNIRNTDKPARAFYLRILDELDFKKEILIKRNEKHITRLYGMGGTLNLKKAIKKGLIHCIKPDLL